MPGRPVVAGGAPLGAEVLGTMVAGEHADRDRQPRRPRQDRAGLGDRLARRSGEQRVAVQLAGLALIGRHAERGIALEMLDRDEALACGERDVGVGHVVLEVNERLGAPRADMPERRGCRRIVARTEALGRRHRAAELAYGCARRADAVRQRVA